MRNLFSILQTIILSLALLMLSITPAISMSLIETKKLAEQGDIDAQLDLGSMYEKGIGVEQDYTKAFSLYQEISGVPQAQYRLGSMYEKGVGVEQNSLKAIYWYQEAAESGVPQAQYRLGSMYEKGDVVRKNIANAKEWFSKSCDNGVLLGCNAYRLLK
jgi:hypothetical protein